MRLHHAALVCSSEEKAARFYGGLLGLEKTKTSRLTEELARSLFGTALECPLILYANEACAIEVFVTERAARAAAPVQHLCVEVEDRGAFMDRCRGQGVEVIQVPKGEATLVFVRDYDGNLFEIKERQGEKAPSAQPEDFPSEVIEALTGRRVKVACEVCDENDWNVLDRAVALAGAPASKDLQADTPHIPCAAMICKHCGNIRLFALGALGLMGSEGR